MEGGDASGSQAVEASGKTVEDAIEAGLAELRLERHEVAIEVLSQGRDRKSVV